MELQSLWNAVVFVSMCSWVKYGQTYCEVQTLWEKGSAGRNIEVGSLININLSYFTSWSYVLYVKSKYVNINNTTIDVNVVEFNVPCAYKYRKTLKYK